MSERAKAAYAAYGEVVGWKNFRGDPMPQFNDLPGEIQSAWDGACEGALRHWLDNEFKDAINDDDEALMMSMALIKVGIESGDNHEKCIRNAICSFVIHCIAPSALDCGPIDLSEG